jgi:hypothetical protein
MSELSTPIKGEQIEHHIKCRKGHEFSVIAPKDAPDIVLPLCMFCGEEFDVLGRSQVQVETEKGGKLIG